MDKKDFLSKQVRHFDIKRTSCVNIVEQFKDMSFQARNLFNAASIYGDMLKDDDCTVILTLAGSIFSAGLKKVVYDMINYNMVDIIVSTGAIIVDQDFFEALGHKHYIGSPDVDDKELLRNYIDRIYDTYIDEEELRDCDLTIKKIADKMPPGVYSSRQFINYMGRYLEENNLSGDSVVRIAYEKDVPIFVPAFSDCSAGFGLIFHQYERDKENLEKVSIDSVKDFLELTKLKMASKETGLFMVSGGVPKNFAQDVTVACDILEGKVNLHKYAIQITVADERDGGLSGSTLKEAHSWGKVDIKRQQMVFAEATIALPLIVSYVYEKGFYKKREMKCLNKELEEVKR
ncbi:MAG: deoxyhypusine synthase [Deferribacterota bacterium]|nr:deoxyhypusine synthase [Deferribacterota bacterium]